MKSGQMPKSSSSCVQRLIRELAVSASLTTAVAAAEPVPLTTMTATTCRRIATALMVAELSDDYVAAFGDILDLCLCSLSA